ncbi:hypothetical protein BDF14DRAFT_1810848 [Spinellus fusiger]|nr:hypothetical protein BDF14DRAFT_1810848 [Spinellus fusiger]
MAFRNGKPIQRYITALCFLFLFAYWSGTRLRNTVTVEERVSDLEYSQPIQHSQQDERVLKEIPIVTLPVDEQVATINRKYCGRDECRFVLPITITEQESKAQEHFRQIAFLSGKLDRTIVLPNVGSSHLGACRVSPFSFYYSHDWLDKNAHFFNYITLDSFNAWLNERRAMSQPPIGQEIFVEMNPQSHTMEKPSNCFRDQMNMDRPPAQFFLDDPEDKTHREGNYTALLLDAMGDRERHIDYLKHTHSSRTTPVPSVEVLHLFYDRRFSFIEDPQVNVPLSYSATWVAIADAIATQLYPFVAVHWRMERLEPVKNMVPCATSLVKKVRALIQHESLPATPNIFLLTDYPHLLTSSKAKPESMSFRLDELRQEHHDAVRYVYERLNVTLTTLDKGPNYIPYDELPATHWNILPIKPTMFPPDKSVLGIVDKLVAMKAQWFFAGKPSVCGKASSFTRRIVAERLASYTRGDPHVLSPLTTFDLP